MMMIMTTSLSPILIATSTTYLHGSGAVGCDYDETNEEYVSFYKSLSEDWENSLAVKHVGAEDPLEFCTFFFTQRRVPFDFFDKWMSEWVSMVKGVLDSEDVNDYAAVMDAAAYKEEQETQ